MLINLIVVIISWVCTYVKIYQIVHFKHMQYIVCQLYAKTKFILRLRLSLLVKDLNKHLSKEGIWMANTSLKWDYFS